ncbi:unnamed protein product [Rhizoctonia solani]|uniref:Uncharacterized protein n=3 Tax=Rhizoctonia solani TaxID=456999 RepID=A0A8H3G8D5_9AGAM|nr:hypothetical protein RSOL_270520 [Rhizoctonia solani AG-3 Rhs1AP]KEP48832.1 hypothetical protein V565_114580 [Rhizoctonia solani 123E]CAE6345940.1 unnamed protein product [Rhizoctonia solani]CAE6441452.1 unnamed protein product [Rhizoctonia solani]
MSLSDGIYKISSVGNDKYRLAFYDSDTVKANDSSNVKVEIKNETGGQRIRFNDSGVNPSTSDWFGYNTDLKPDNRVVQRTDKQGLTGDNLLWAVTSAGPDQYTIKVWNGDHAWSLPDSPKNPSDIYLEPAAGKPGQLWKIAKA